MMQTVVYGRLEMLHAGIINAERELRMMIINRVNSPALRELHDGFSDLFETVGTHFYDLQLHPGAHTSQGDWDFYREQLARAQKLRVDAERRGFEFQNVKFEPSPGDQFMEYARYLHGCIQAVYERLVAYQESTQDPHKYTDSIVRMAKTLAGVAGTVLESWETTMHHQDGPSDRDHRARGTLQDKYDALEADIRHFGIPVELPPRNQP